MPRLNFTGRKRIMREDCQISLMKVREHIYKPEIELKLDKYDFPHSAAIYLELSNREFFWRRSFGTLAKPGFSGPSTINVPSDEVSLSACVKIVNECAKTAKILGLMKNTRILGPEGSAEGNATRSFIEVAPGDLGPKVWTLELHDDEDAYPVLIVNKNINNARAMVKDPLFRSVVMPVVLERILEVIVIRYRFRDFESSSVWGRILAFAAEMAPAEAVRAVQPNSSDEDAIPKILDWIDEVVCNWSAQHNYPDVFDESWNRRTQS